MSAVTSSAATNADTMALRTSECSASEPPTYSPGRNHADNAGLSRTSLRLVSTALTRRSAGSSMPATAAVTCPVMVLASRCT
ncbi:hypothetical protein MYCSP_06180 [Mycobacteroides saopaulense]|nr:hypothetical protein MYCSP_06180 [Mycobacteroides saopaulense]